MIFSLNADDQALAVLALTHMARSRKTLRGALRQVAQRMGAGFTFDAYERMIENGYIPKLTRPRRTRPRTHTP